MKVLAAQWPGRAQAPLRLGTGLVVVACPSPEARRDLVEGLAGAVCGRPGPGLVTVDVRGQCHTLGGTLLARLAIVTTGRSPVLGRAPANPPTFVPDVGHRISAFREQLRALERRQRELIDAIVAGSPSAAAVESVRVALAELGSVDPASVHAKRTAYRLRQVLSRIYERRTEDPDEPELVRLRGDLARVRHDAVVALADDGMTDEEMVGVLEAHHGPAVAANRPWQRLMDAVRAAGIDTRGLEPVSAARRWLGAADQGGRERQAAYDELGALAVAIPVVRRRVLEVSSSSRRPEHDEPLAAALARIHGAIDDHRGDDVLGTIPLIVDDAFDRVDPADLPAVLAELVVAAVAVQVVYVTDDADVVAAARDLGGHAEIVELCRAID